MKFIPFICLAFLISCGKKEEKTTIETPKQQESEMYTLETKNFFIDVPQGFAVNEMKIANKYAIQDFVKADSLQYFFIASDNNDSKSTLDFSSDFLNSDLDLNAINHKLFQDYKQKFQSEIMDISEQKDTILRSKKINYLVFQSLINDKPEQTMYVMINENGKLIQMNFKNNDISEPIQKNKTNWKIIESIGLK